MPEWFGRIAGLFALFCAIYALQAALSRWFPTVFSRTGVFISRKKGSRSLRSRFEMHALVVSTASVLSIFVIFRDGFIVEILLIWVAVLLCALFELSENIIFWNRRGIVQRKFFFHYRSIDWDNIVALNINMPVDGVVFSDSKSRIQFKARFEIDEHGEMYVPTKDVVFGVRALARYARMRLRNRSDVNWYAS